MTREEQDKLFEQFQEVTISSDVRASNMRRCTSTLTTESRVKNGKMCRDKKVGFHKDEFKNAVYKCSHCQQTLMGNRGMLHSQHCIFSHIPIDELQDINKSPHTLTRMYNTNEHIVSRHSIKLYRRRMNLT